MSLDVARILAKFYLPKVQKSHIFSGFVTKTGVLFYIESMKKSL